MSPQEPRVTPEIGVKPVNFLVDIGDSFLVLTERRIFI